MGRSGHIRRWIEQLPEQGRYSFTRQELLTRTTSSVEAVHMTLHRLKKQGRIVSPRRGFHVIVPPEYRAAGSPPATWFIDPLMEHLERPYYVGLLSAAALHGASHQQPMAFQVIVDAPTRPIEVGRVRIEFHSSNRIAKAKTLRMETETGTMVVATPETTAFDLVHFCAAAGNWGNVATVLSELSSTLDARSLGAGVEGVPRSDVQRLGWLLDVLGSTDLADALAARLEGKRLVSTRLSTSRPTPNASVDSRWKILVNDVVEPDL